MKRFASLKVVASGAAIGLIIAGILAVIGGSYAKKVVHDQLTPQKISFTSDKAELPGNLKKYAGEQVDTGAEAKAFADDYIAMHLQGIGKGKTYSEVSGEFMKDPTNTKLAETRQTLFMGETLRGMLLNAWGWSVVGTVSTIAGIVLIVTGAILLALALLGARAQEREAAGYRARPGAAPA